MTLLARIDRRRRTGLCASPCCWRSACSRRAAAGAADLHRSRRRPVLQPADGPAPPSRHASQPGARAGDHGDLFSLHGHRALDPPAGGRGAAGAAQHDDRQPGALSHLVRHGAGLHPAWHEGIEPMVAGTMQPEDAFAPVMAPFRVFMEGRADPGTIAMLRDARPETVPPSAGEAPGRRSRSSCRRSCSARSAEASRWAS